MQHRSLKPLLSGISLAVLLVLTTAFYSLGYVKLSPERSFQLKRSHRLLAYKITSNQGVRFRVQPGWNRLEIISNLDLPPNTDETSGSIDYALRIRLLDRKMKCLSDTVYWERTRRTTWTDPKTKITLSGAFYLYESMLPCDSRITTFFLPENRTQICFVEVRLAKPSGATASIRAYHHENLIGEQELKSVKPLSRRLRAKIARHNLFGLKAKDSEIKRFLKDVWRQIPAEGRAGTDYVSRALFLYDNPLPVSGNPPVEWFRLVDASVHLSFLGPATLSFQTDSDGIVQLRRISSTGDIDVFQLRAIPEEPLRIPFGDGRYLVTLSTENPALHITPPKLDPSSAWIESNGYLSNIFNVPVQHLRYARILPDNEGPPVILDIPPIDSDFQRRIKIICRIPIEKSKLIEKPFTVHYRFLNKQRQSIREGTFSDRLSASPFTRFADNDSAEPVCPSRPGKYIIQVPSDAEILELRSDKPVDAAFYTFFPSNKSGKTCRKPAGSNPTNPLRNIGIRFIDSDADRSWFYFRPFNIGQLENTGRWIAMAMPPGIIETSRPAPEHQKKTQSRAIRPSSPVPEETIYETCSCVTPGAAHKYLYYRVAPGQPVHIQVSGTNPVFPMVRYQLSGYSDPVISLVIDDETISSFRPLTTFGNWSVPGLSPGRHTFLVQSTSPNDIFYLQAHPSLTADTTLYRARRVYRLEPGGSLNIQPDPVNFHCRGMNIMVYPETEPAKPFTLTMTRTGGTTTPVSKGLTPDRLCFTIDSTQNSSQDTKIKTLHGKPLTGPFRFFYPIKDDLARENLRFRVSLTSEQPVYVRFFILEKDTG